jgi:hypothetical protein
MLSNKLHRLSVLVSLVCIVMFIVVVDYIPIKDRHDKLWLIFGIWGIGFIAVAISIYMTLIPFFRNMLDRIRR